MSALQFAAFGVGAAVIALLLRRVRPEAGTMVALSGGVMLALAALPLLTQVVENIAALAQSGGIQDGYMAQLLKVGGISLLMDFAAQTCRDAGEEGLAMKVEFAGRVMLISLSLPVMQTLLGQILSLAPS